MSFYRYRHKILSKIKNPTVVHEHTVSKNLYILYAEYVTEKWKEEMSTRAVGHSIIFHWLMLINKNLILFCFFVIKTNFISRCSNTNMDKTTNNSPTPCQCSIKALIHYIIFVVVMYFTHTVCKNTHTNMSPMSYLLCKGLSLTCRQILIQLFLFFCS